MVVFHCYVSLPEGSYLTHRFHGNDPFTLGPQQKHMGCDILRPWVFSVTFFAAKSVGIPGVFEETPL